MLQQVKPLLSSWRTSLGLFFEVGGKAEPWLTSFALGTPWVMLGDRVLEGRARGGYIFKETAGDTCHCRLPLANPCQLKVLRHTHFLSVLY